MSGLTKFFSANNTEFFELFDIAGANVLHGAELLSQLLHARQDDRTELAKQIVACEHEGDAITRKITDRLNKTFVTPFDREDIYELASKLDDVLDFIEEAADYISLYQIEAIRPEALKQSELVRLAMEETAAALPKLNGFKDISAHTNEVYRLERAGDRVVRDAIAGLFHGEEDAKTLLAWKDMFERLEDALDACKHAASSLKGITIRNS